jgi:hypothetical protein
VNVDPSNDNWILYDDAYAASQFNATVSTCRTEPRSTRHHCPSANPDDHRVAELPSFANCGPTDESSDADANTGCDNALSARTTTDTADNAGTEAPAPFVAVTATRTVCPTSATDNPYDEPVAPPIA